MVTIKEVSGNFEFKGLATTGSLTDSAAGDVACDARIPVLAIDGTTYYIPLFNTAV